MPRTSPNHRPNPFQQSYISRHKQHRSQHFLWVTCAAFLLAVAPLAAADPATPLVKVNGVTLTTADLEFYARSRGLDDAAIAQQRAALLEQLIDRQLIRSFLATKKAIPDPDLLDLQVEQLESLTRRRGEDPAVLFPKLGLTPERLRAELGLTLAWQGDILKTTPVAELRAYFEAHRAEFDGTRVRVRQIVRPGANPEQITAAETLLTDLKRDITAGTIGFEEAARKHSTAPSREQGGDAGWVSGRGELPEAVTLAGLSLKAGELAGPIRSPFGVHLIQVTERQPGQLSLEDARPQILMQFAQERWIATVASERKTARIIRP
jgi:peptidyl-prolyl cis-trans isomerase C